MRNSRNILLHPWIPDSRRLWSSTGIAIVPAAIVVMAAASVLCYAPLSVAAEAAKTERPKDAAEAVGEGNVRQWIEYYERTRPNKEPTVSRPANTAPTDATGGVQPPPATPKQ